MVIRCIGNCHQEGGILCFDGKSVGKTTLFSATVCGKVIKGVKKLLCGRANCLCEGDDGVSIFNYQTKEMRPLAIGAVVRRMGTRAEVYSANHRGEQMTFSEAVVIVGADGKLCRCEPTVAETIEEI